MPVMMLSLFPLFMKNIKMIIMSMLMALMYSLMNLNQPEQHMIFLTNDKISFVLITLTLMTSTMVIMSSMKKNIITFLVMINLMLVTAFYSSSMVNFYIAFEMSIIPTFMLIMKMGPQPERSKASMFLLMYTVFASLPLLLAITKMSPTINMMLLPLMSYSLSMPILFILAFLVKLPMFTLHLWLPKAHVEAPMEGSMILAAILLKLGSYGMMRMLPMMKKFSKMYSTHMMSLSLLGCIYTSAICNRQKDIKAMIAYSSVAHMALIIISLFSLSKLGLTSSILMTTSHAFSSSALFFMATLSYSPYHSRNIYMFKGASNFSPNMSMWWFIFTAANIGTPPFLNLLSEIMAITSAMTWSMFTSTMILMAGMMMTAFSIMMFSLINHNSPSSSFKTPPLLTAQSLTLLIHSLPLTIMLLNPNSLM